MNNKSTSQAKNYTWRAITLNNANEIHTMMTAAAAVDGANPPPTASITQLLNRLGDDLATQTQMALAADTTVAAIGLIFFVPNSEEQLAMTQALSIPTIADAGWAVTCCSGWKRPFSTNLPNSPTSPRNSSAPAAPTIFQIGSRSLQRMAMRLHGFNTKWGATWMSN